MLFNGALSAVDSKLIIFLTIPILYWTVNKSQLAWNLCQVSWLADRVNGNLQFVQLCKLINTACNGLVSQDYTTQHLPGLDAIVTKFHCRDSKFEGELILTWQILWWQQGTEEGMCPVHIEAGNTLGFPRDSIVCLSFTDPWSSGLCCSFSLELLFCWDEQWICIEAYFAEGGMCCHGMGIEEDMALGLCLWFCPLSAQEWDRQVCHLLPEVRGPHGAGRRAGSQALQDGDCVHPAEKSLPPLTPLQHPSALHEWNVPGEPPQLPLCWGTAP